LNQDSVITNEMRAAIGVESEPSIREVEKGAIRRFADAIGDPNPLYHDEEHAAKSKYGAIICPPSFFGWVVRSARPTRTFQSPFTRGYNGGNEYEFFKPIKAGDVLTTTSKIVDMYERQGGPQTGRMLFTVMETTFKNQDGEIVAKSRGTGISYEGPRQVETPPMESGRLGA